MSVIMKTFLIALLALPAVLAAPAEITDPPTVAAGEYLVTDWECSCTDGKGNYTESACLYAGVRSGPDNKWCRAASKWMLGMDKRYTDEICARGSDTLVKGECHPIRLCQSSLVPYADNYQICAQQ
ncbi:hypothetical protein VTL71DRAFT_1203 [Oculimacula yallundae]|uniref:Uncharacterized protein n=1 Tax=Oculimacula yallundae TaxID=86028 RepID=A0ABR4D2C9_9HELO